MLFISKLQNSNLSAGQRGGILTASRKRKLQEIVAIDREAHMEMEQRKKYTGPVGKNPWGSIAKDWAGASRPRDYADELRLFARQRGVDIKRQTSIPKINLEEDEEEMEEGGDGDVRVRLGPPVKDWDWDAPEGEGGGIEDIDPIAASLHRHQAGKRGLGRSMSPLGEPVDYESDEEDRGKWNKRLKRPRMAMVADEEEEQSRTKKKAKRSAKDRLFTSPSGSAAVTGLRRRISNPPVSVEVYEEEEEEEEVATKNVKSGGDEDLRMTITNDAAAANAAEDAAAASKKGLNERFHGRAGRGPSTALLSRLGGRLTGGRGSDDRGDSLERDTGEDLRGELEEGHAANMLIQVTQSDKEDEEDGGVMDQDKENIKEERSVRRRAGDESPPAEPKAAAPVSQVVRVKQEKGVVKAENAPRKRSEDIG